MRTKGLRGAVLERTAPVAGELWVSGNDSRSGCRSVGSVRRGESECVLETRESEGERGRSALNAFLF